MSGRPLPKQEAANGANHPEAPFFKRASRRRIELAEAMVDVEDAIARTSSMPGWVSRVELALLGLSSAIDAHSLEVESSDGILGDILATAPRLEHEVESIKAEHGDLRHSCSRTLALFNQDESADPLTVRRAVLALLGRLAQHRQRGSELVYDAYNVDIGAGD